MAKTLVMILIDSEDSSQKEIEDYYKEATYNDFGNGDAVYSVFSTLLAEDENIDEAATMMGDQLFDMIEEVEEEKG